jgi:hypothetical protein
MRLGERAKKGLKVPGGGGGGGVGGTNAVKFRQMRNCKGTEREEIERVGKG